VVKLGIMRETSTSLEGTRGDEAGRVQAAISAIDRRQRRSRLHVWSIGSATSALSLPHLIDDIPLQSSEESCAT